MGPGNFDRFGRGSKGSWARPSRFSVAPVCIRCKGISGKIQSIGSDSMQGLMLRWAARFREGYPSVQFEIEGAGSSKAIPGLIAGADVGPMSRDLRASEIRDFETRYNYPPTIIPTAMDLVIVVVHRDNPIPSLTLPELDAIFSSTRKSGALRSIRTWGEIGGREEYRQASIVTYGRNAASGTYGFFKESVMGGGDFKDSVSEQPGATSVVQAVGTNRFAIGYSGTGHKTESVRIVPLATNKSSKAVMPTREMVANREYPLARFLYLCLNIDPKKSEGNASVREFVRFVYSREGQEIVQQEGYYPLDQTQAASGLRQAGWQP